MEIGKIKGSRFIARLEPVSSAAEAEAVISSAAREHPSANHHCYAWRLACGMSRAADAGEPRGSAGQPILKRLESSPAGGSERAGVVDAALVVTRYFGGTKLGIGGLVRAYGAAAAEVLSIADMEPVRRMQSLRFRHGYADSGFVQSVLGALEDARVCRDFAEDVLVEVELPAEHSEAVRRLLSEGSSGRIRWP